MSRTPNSDRCSVRGIGVAVIVSTSTVCRRALSRSFTSTPNRCSSSMITSPRLWNCTSCCASRCVPMTMSIEPSARPARMSRVSLGVQKRDSAAIGERELGHPGPERAQVLLGQDRGGHEHGHLVAGVDRLEGGPHRQLGLAVADVAAQQPVHRPRLLHVGLDGRDRRQLVGRFHVGERGVELALPVACRPESGCRAAARGRLAARACRRPGR